MDSLELFSAVVSRGLWIEKPGDIVPTGSRSNRVMFIISDIGGQQVARSKDQRTAVLKAYGAITRELTRQQKQINK